MTWTGKGKTAQAYESDQRSDLMSCDRLTGEVSFTSAISGPMGLTLILPEGIELLQLMVSLANLLRDSAGLLLRGRLMAEQKKYP